MSVGGVGGANDLAMQMMQVLLQGMQEQMALSQKAIAMNVENGIAAEKMAIAQNIIDVYA